MLPRAMTPDSLLNMDTVETAALNNDLSGTAAQTLAIIDAFDLFDKRIVCK
jgi:hypothetical protein